jgi:hypothetical protein
MYQLMPPIIVFIIIFIFLHTEIEYFQEDIIGECSDCHLSVKLAYAAQIQESLRKGLAADDSPLLPSTHSSFRRRTMSFPVFEALMAGAKEVWWNE